ncbi:uncharacterized protein LOC103280169 [Anolis carolinensis]|uniref:uncharacterized protein LOC103280169 n=1 Tax=Anolis carolinensis TaxID=28377 RepID=UPI002F2B53E6
MLRRSERLAALPPISYRETGVRRVFKKINRKRHAFTTERAFEDRAMDSIPCCTPTWTAPRRRQRKTLWVGLIFLAFLFGISLRFILSARLFAEKEKGNTVKTFLDPPVQEKTAPVRQENEGVKKNLEKAMVAFLPRRPELDSPPDNTENIHANIRAGMSDIFQSKEANNDFPLKTYNECKLWIGFNRRRSRIMLLRTDKRPQGFESLDASQGSAVMKVTSIKRESGLKEQKHIQFNIKRVRNKKFKCVCTIIVHD